MENLIPVPYGNKVSVRIRRENGYAYVEVHAPLYVNKLWDMPHCYYAADFTDGQILRDHNFIRVLTNGYGKRD